MDCQNDVSIEYLILFRRLSSFSRTNLWGAGEGTLIFGSTVKRNLFSGSGGDSIILGSKGGATPPPPLPHLGNREIGILTIHWQQTGRKMAIHCH